jgi:hypothetical protein
METTKTTRNLSREKVVHTQQLQQQQQMRRSMLSCEAIERKFKLI